MIGYSRAFNELYGPKPIEGKFKMNKRILKLFNEAGFHQPEMERLGIEDKFEKFAELVVRECIQTLRDNTPVVDEHNSVEDWDRGYIRGMVDCEHHIKEHFGVEE